jgi:hypothetical protein
MYSITFQKHTGKGCFELYFEGYFELYFGVITFAISL